jgi:glucose-6-phosphate 1-epimerase
MSESAGAIISSGLGGMPKICLSSRDGAKAEIYLHGAHVTSWTPAGGEERLYLSQKSIFQPGTAIRGGVPVIFPQFGDLGTLPKHGFARTQPWNLTSMGSDQHSTTVELCLVDNETTQLLWPYPFQLNLKVMIGGTHMELKLSVENTGDTSFPFTAALHTYLRVEDILTTSIDGLHGLHYHDTANRLTLADWVERVQNDPRVNFPGEVDRVYYNVTQPLKVCDSNRITSVTSEGFRDVVIWNPGPGKSARLTDLGQDGYRNMVCVEAAIVGAPVILKPGGTWQGAQILLA